MSKKKTVRKKHIAMIMAAIIAGVILSVAFMNYTSTEDGLVVKDEIVYFIIVSLIVLTIALVVMLLAMAFGKKGSSLSNAPIRIKNLPFNFSGVTPKKKEESEEEGGSRFYTLSSIDANKTKYQKGGHNETITLREFCEEFRNFAGSKLKLYYSIDDIRRFIAGMAVSKIVILQGMSGTGKTSLAFAMGEFLSNPSSVIPVQPMWKERTDLVGYYNEFTKRFNETTLLQKMYEANYSKDIYVTILDEFNIARVEYYFAEFLSLLEIPDPERRNLDVVSDEWENDPVQLNEGRMKLPNNMWFIGTANNDDSTFAISDKVYDRAMIMNLDKNCEPCRAPRTKGVRITAERFMKMAEDAVKEYSISKRNEKRLEKLDEYMVKVFHITFGNRIMKQIRTYIPIYVACGGEELEALDDILSKKVLRKLETQNPVYIRSVVDGFCDYLDDLFGYDKMKLCKEYVQFIKKNV